MYAVQSYWKAHFVERVKHKIQKLKLPIVYCLIVPTINRNNAVNINSNQDKDICEMWTEINEISPNNVCKTAAILLKYIILKQLQEMHLSVAT